jgi:hypothetical protein
MLQVRQPWAEVEVKPAQPTAEEREWLEKEGFIKDEEDEGEEGDKEQDGRGRVRSHSPSRGSSCRQRLSGAICCFRVNGLGGGTARSTVARGTAEGEGLARRRAATWAGK